MHHLIAWQESIDSAAAFTPITGVPDPTAQVTGDLIYIPVATPFLIGAIAALEGTAETQAYLTSPSLRANAEYDIWPTYDVIEPGDSLNTVLHPYDPVALAATEGMEAYINSNPGAASIQSVVAFLSDGPLTPVTGEMLHVRFTAAITETLGVWTNGQITLRQALPVGNYQIVGASVHTVSGVAFRFNIVEQFQRPGFTTHTTEAEYDSPLQRNGAMGVWGEFHSLVPPTIEILAMATAGTAQNGILDLIRL